MIICTESLKEPPLLEIINENITMANVVLNGKNANTVPLRLSTNQDVLFHHYY